MSNYYTTGEFDIPRGTIAHRCTAFYWLGKDGPKPQTLTIVRTIDLEYEATYTTGKDAIRYDCPQWPQLEAHLLRDFVDVILQACEEHAAANAGVHDQ